MFAMHSFCTTGCWVKGDSLLPSASPELAQGCRQMKESKLPDKSHIEAPALAIGALTSQVGMRTPMRMSVKLDMRSGWSGEPVTQRPLDLVQREGIEDVVDVRQGMSK